MNDCSKKELKELFHQLELHKVELEVQNRELKESHHLLEESRNQHLHLYDHSPVGYLTLDKNGLIEECNLTTARLLHTEVKRLKKRLFRNWVHSDDRAILTAHLCRCAQARQSMKITSELRVCPSDSENDFFVELHTTVHIDEPTGSLFFYTALVDVSDRKRADLAEAANQSKSVFLANMSHEIRTPLGAMLGFVELLNSPEASSSQKEKCLEVIRRNGEVLSHLIDDILDLSKVEADQMELEYLEFSLAQLLTELKDLFTLKAEEKGLLLKFALDCAVPEKVISDPIRIRQILSNLIMNAIKFTEKGAVDVLVSNQILDDELEMLKIEIVDTGRGIKPAQRFKLFKNFSQADNSTTRKFGGTGLGLALSRKLARLLGGDIVLKDKPSTEGCTFVATLQVGRVIPTFTQLENIKTKESDHKETLNGLHVLLVEDSPDNQMLIEHLLVEKGATVDVVNNGQEGVHSAMKQGYNLVLMDVQMPLMDGHEATRELRSLGCQTPIVALSAHAMKEDREKSFHAGCNFHITKPITSKVLTATVKQYAAQR